MSSGGRSSREGAALSGAGKRAAFALFYGPLHYLLMPHIVEQLPGATAERRHAGRSRLRHRRVGRGVGRACGPAADANRQRPARRRDRSPSVGDRRSGRDLSRVRTSGDRPPGRTSRARPAERAGVDPRGVHAERAGRCGSRRAARAAGRARGPRRSRADRRAARRIRRALVESLARRFEAAGGRADEWRLRTELPPIVAKLDRAAGLNHREITGRSLWL